MKIKDVEKRVGITRANIRYYEKEGLLSPNRDQENNYREYSEDDVKRLEQIKVLRMLGVSISDIKELKEGRITLNKVMDKRLEQIYEEEKNLKEVEDACRSIRWQNISIEEVNERILVGSAETWKEQFERIWKEDITKEILTTKQLNRNLALMLTMGYLLNVFVAYLVGDFFLKYQGDGIGGMLRSNGLLKLMESEQEGGNWQTMLFDKWKWLIFMFIISIICYIVLYWSSNIKVQTVNFFVEVLVLTPLISGIFLLLNTLVQSGRMREEINQTVSGMHLAAFWIAIMFYVIFLFFISEVWEKLFTKARYIVGVAAVYTVIMTVVAGAICDLWIEAAIAFFVFTVYVGVSWYHVNGDASEKGASRYYAITNASRIMNIGGVVQNMRGKTRWTSIYR